MKVRLVFPVLSFAALSLVFASGCTPQRKAAETAPAENAFALKLPPGRANVAQNAQTEITVAVNRGSKFDQDVKLTFKAPDGVQITPESVTAKKGADEAKITVRALETATPGNLNITVTGTPATGSAVKSDLGIEVRKKS